MQNRKVVGVMPLWDDEKDSIWMLPGYMDGLKTAGLDAFIFPLTDDVRELKRFADLCDGVLLTGGHDVNPAVYHESPINDSVVWNDTRDSMDQTVIRYALEKDKGILGICRGIQILNVTLGGTLYQDLPTQYRTETRAEKDGYPSSLSQGREKGKRYSGTDEKAINHNVSVLYDKNWECPSEERKPIDHHMSAPYDRPCHEADIAMGTPLYDLLQKKRIPVNSIHHQAIKDLAPGLEEMARSEDGLVEAVWMPGRRFVWGIQWHPEYWFRTNPDCMKIFQCFADSL